MKLANAHVSTALLYLRNQPFVLFFLQGYLLEIENSKALYWIKGLVFLKKLSYTEIPNLVKAWFNISCVAALT